MCDYELNFIRNLKVHQIDYTENVNTCITKITQIQDLSIGNLI